MIHSYTSSNLYHCCVISRAFMMWSMVTDSIRALSATLLHKLIHQDFHEAVASMTIINSFLFIVQSPLHQMLLYNMLYHHHHYAVLIFYSSFFFLHGLCRLFIPLTSQGYGIVYLFSQGYCIWLLDATFTKSTTSSTLEQQHQKGLGTLLIFHSEQMMENIMTLPMKLLAANALLLAEICSLWITKIRSTTNHISPYNT